jgi:hypothetical protein
MRPTLLKVLLSKRHWQKYETFCREYKRVERDLNPERPTGPPSQAQYYRWLTGKVKGGRPYPDACRVLEAMFPEWSAENLLQPCPDNVLANEVIDPRAKEVNQLLTLIDSGLNYPNAVKGHWGPASLEELQAHRLPASIEPIPPALSEHDSQRSDSTAKLIAKRLITLQQTERLSQEETRQLSALTGNIVDLEAYLAIDIPSDGWAHLETRYVLLNLTSSPVARVAKEFWFEHTRDSALIIEPIQEDGSRMTIHRMHDTRSLTKFACQFSPAVQPGESRAYRYTCDGGRFVSDHYWRHSFPRYTRRFTLSLRHRGVKPLLGCSAVEELSDGSEKSATEQLVWDYEGDDVVFVLTRDYLEPNQAVTLRWEVTHNDDT